MSDGETTPAYEEADGDFMDTQINYLAGLALIVLLICLVLGYVFSTGISTASAAFQLVVNEGTTRIRAQLPGLFSQIENSVRTIQTIGEQGLNAVTSAVVNGVQIVVNVGLSAGQSLLNFLSYLLTTILSILNEIGADLLPLFESIMQPIVTIIGIYGQVIIDALTVIVATYTPILTLIESIINVILTIEKYV
jgi:phage-related minor tail protein